MKNTEPKWRVEYDNDTGPRDESLREWWTVTNDDMAFECDSEMHADWLCIVLNKWSEPDHQKPVEPTPFPPHEIITWDWKERCPTQSVIEACKQFAGPVSFDVETNCDEYAIVIGGSGMTQKIADAIYHAPLRWRSACGRYSVQIAPACYRAMLVLARKHHPNEIGTALVGCYARDGFSAYITALAPLAPDSRGSRTTFRRGTIGLAEFFAGTAARTNGARYYVGEWHSHPDAAPSPSGTDRRAQIAICRDCQADCPEALLIVLGGSFKGEDQRLSIHVFSRTAGEIALFPETASKTAKS